MTRADSSGTLFLETNLFILIEIIPAILFFFNWKKLD
jgi:hypothetical protein